MGPLTVLVAPDSFKGSLTAVEVARSLAAGWSRVRPEDTILLAPMADGGEGTLVAIEAAGGWEWRTAPAHDPLGRELSARWLRSADGRSAVVELAAASGLSRLAPAERDPLLASTFGTGEVLRAVLDEGIRRIDLGVGGSATTDGGLGLLAALGLAMTVEPTLVIHLDELDDRLAQVDLRIACDVTNPLLGPSGAAAVYGPQKGASEAQVRELDAALARWADALEGATGRRERDTPGAGAAGGTTFGLACLRDRFRSFAIVPGVEVLMETTGFDAKLGRADLVLTGEGRIDAQTAYGKTAPRRRGAGRSGRHAVRCRWRRRDAGGSGRARGDRRDRGAGDRATAHRRRGNGSRRTPARAGRRANRAPRRDRRPGRRPACGEPRRRRGRRWRGQLGRGWRGQPGRGRRGQPGRGRRRRGFG